MPVRFLSYDIDDDDVLAVKAALAAAEFPMAAVVDVRGIGLSRVQRAPISHGRGDRPDPHARYFMIPGPESTMAVAIWMTVPVGWVLTQFAAGMAKRAGEETFSALKRFVTSILTSGKKTPLHGVVLRDTERQVELELTDDLPSEAYKRLEQLDLEGLLNARLYYDQIRGEWVMAVPRRTTRRRAQPRGRR